MKNKNNKKIALNLLNDALQSSNQFSWQTDFKPNAFFPLPMDVRKDVIIIGSISDTDEVESFLAKRKNMNSGKNWYILHYEAFASDFSIQFKMSSYQKLALIHRLDVAFKHTPNEALELRQSLFTRSRALFEWLQGGAHLYIGTLLQDIEPTLLRIFQLEGKFSYEQSVQFLNQLKKERRFINLAKDLLAAVSV